ncbi:MAG: sulfoxide reductase catalytic subunit YedY, partial [Maritalea sp.]
MSVVIEESHKERDQMLIKTKKSWEIAEREATPEGAYLNRRQIMAGAGAIGLAGALGTIRGAFAATDNERMAMSAIRNEAFQLDRELTPEDINLNYNNFYEFGSHKEIAKDAQAL